MIWIGTSGFQYPEWKGKFYPADLSAAKMLPFYAERFSTTEINYSFYRIPTESTLLKWAEATPQNFRFGLKAPRKITHQQQLVGSDELLDRFWNVAQVLREKLGPILFQLPPFLKKDLPRLETFLNGLPKGIKATFEFRHESWLDEEVFAALKSRDAGLCIANSEKLSTPVEITGSFGYFRLRNRYSTADLKQWAKIIRKAEGPSRDIFVYFKHEETGSGPEYARQLADFLSD